MAVYVTESERAFGGDSRRQSAVPAEVLVPAEEQELSGLPAAERRAMAAAVQTWLQFVKGAHR